MGDAASRPGDYSEPDLPKNVWEVRLSVYTFDLTGVSLLNSLGSSMAGAYHTGLVVAGEEWSFGGHDQPGETGVYLCRPEMNPEYQFYSRLVMGRVKGSEMAVRSVLNKLAESEHWSGCRYNLLENNCNHFCSDACWALLRRRPPDWINKTAEKMARQHRTSHVKEQSLRLALASYKARFGDPSDLDNAPGAAAFKDSFQSTFDIALARHGSLFELSAAYADLEAVARGDVTLPSDEVVPLPGAEEKEKDIVALRRRAEKRGFETVAMAAKSLAHVVAHAARRAAAARDLQPEEGLEAWDDAWARASAPLLSQWREEAVAQRLKVDFSDAAAPHTAARMAHQERDRQVEEALQIAAAAAAVEA